MTVTPQSAAAELRATSAERATRSLSFFVRNLLGLRSYSATRLKEIQDGNCVVELSSRERVLVEKWSQFCRGEMLPETSWLGAAPSVAA
jgi:hypothetical protein